MTIDYTGNSFSAKITPTGTLVVNTDGETYEYRIWSKRGNREANAFVEDDRVIVANAKKEFLRLKVKDDEFKNNVRRLADAASREKKNAILEEIFG